MLTTSTDTYRPCLGLSTARAQSESRGIGCMFGANELHSRDVPKDARLSSCFPINNGRQAEQGKVGVK